MSNNIKLVEKYQPLIDEVFKKESLTKDLESGDVKFDGTQTVKIMKLTLPEGLSDHTRGGGFTRGDLSVNWESWKLTQDRDKELFVDAMDNEETLDLTFGKASSEFIRTVSAPEVDMYRFAKLAATENITKHNEIFTSGEEVMKALARDMSQMDDDEVPEEGRILYITSAALTSVEQLDTYKSREALKKFAKIVKVPTSRFVDAVKKNENGALVKGDNANALNYLIVYPKAQQAVAKHVKLRVFTPDENQDDDGYKFQYRIYHDIFVYENRVAGICSSVNSTAELETSENAVETASVKNVAAKFTKSTAKTETETVEK